jgi:ATP-dependent Clp protease ATP-binding subunit ClpA
LGEIGLTPSARKVIELAVDEARRLNHHYIGTEHLLLGLMREGKGIAAGVLESLGVNLEKVRTQTIQVLRTTSVPLQAASKEASRSTEEAPDALREAIKELEAILNEKEAAIQQQEYKLAADLRDREVKQRADIARLEAAWLKEQQHKKPSGGEEDDANRAPS